MRGNLFFKLLFIGVYTTVAALISYHRSTSLLLFLDEDLGVLHEEVHVELVFRFLILVRANVKEHFILINRILIFVDWVQ